MNPRLSRLQPYPFGRLRQWFADVTPNPALAPISLSFGEPRHPAPAHVADALAAGMSGFANYPTTIGPLALREAIASWLARRRGLVAVDPATRVLPALGSRAALLKAFLRYRTYHGSAMSPAGAWSAVPVHRR